MTTTPIQKHLETVNALLARIGTSLAPEALREPDRPVHIFLDEGNNVAVAAQEHLDALTAVGMDPALPGQLQEALAGTQSAQVLWVAESRKGRTAETDAAIDEGMEVRREFLDAADLAFRKHPLLQERVTRLREGEGLADLVQDLVHGAALMHDGATQLKAIRFDVEGNANRMTALAEALQHAFSLEEVAKGLSGHKEKRDRCYSYAAGLMTEIRLFANYAFRKDTHGKRRAAFSSAYLRRKNRSVPSPLPTPMPA